MTEEKLWLYVDESKESEIALNYFNTLGIEVSTLSYETAGGYDRDLADNVACPYFCNSLEEKRTPLLLITHKFEMPVKYVSFSGVKSFLREKIGILKNNGEKKVNYWKHRCSRLLCFDENSDIIFEGNQEESPYEFKDILNRHDYKGWRDISCWRIGRLEELLIKKDEKSIIFNERTGIVLFSDDVEILRAEKIVVNLDSRCSASVEFEAYFNRGGEIYGVWGFDLD